MQLLRVDDCGNCKTSIERICQVRVGWECCRYLLNVRLPTLALGLLTRFTGDNKNNDVIKHILPVGMLVSWYPDTHIYHLNESVKWQVRRNKIALAVVLETVCGAWLLAEKFKKWKTNPFLNGGDIERQSSSELSFRSSVNMFDYKCWKFVNILGSSVALHQNPQLALILNFYLLALQLLGHGVLRGMCWKKLHMDQIGTDVHKIPKWLLVKTVYHISWAAGDSITCSLVRQAKWNLIIILLLS